MVEVLGMRLDVQSRLEFGRTWEGCATELDCQAHHAWNVGPVDPPPGTIPDGTYLCCPAQPQPTTTCSSLYCWWLLFTLTIVEKTDFGHRTLLSSRYLATIRG